MAIDVETRRPKLSNIVGGLSGPAIRPIAVRMVYECRRAVKLPIIGMGGISTAADVLEFMIAGATAVQVGTANFVDPFHLAHARRGPARLHGAPRHHPSGRAHGQPRHLQAGTSVDQLLVALDVEDGPAAIALADNAARCRRRLQGRQPPLHHRRPRYRPHAVARRRPRLPRPEVPRHPQHRRDRRCAAATSLGVWMVNVHASGGTRDDAGGARRGARDGGARRADAAARHRRHGAHEHERGDARRNRRARAGPRSGPAAGGAGAGCRTRWRRGVAAGDGAHPATMRAGFRDRDAGDSWQRAHGKRDRHRKTIRSGRSGRPRRLPPAPATSSSAGRSSPRPTRARRRKRLPGS